MLRVALVLFLTVSASACPPPRLDAGAQKAGAVEFKLDSEPGGAEVVVDGIPRGTAPVTLHLTPGSHRVKLSKSGYFALESAVEVTAGGAFTGRMMASH